jgi:hypothetical protein
LADLGSREFIRQWKVKNQNAVSAAAAVVAADGANMNAAAVASDDC